MGLPIPSETKILGVNLDFVDWVIAYQAAEPTGRFGIQKPSGQAVGDAVFVGIEVNCPQLELTLGAKKGQLSDAAHHERVGCIGLVDGDDGRLVITFGDHSFSFPAFAPFSTDNDNGK